MSAPSPSRDDLGFLLAKAMHRWNELLAAGFAAAGFPEVRPSYGSVLVPLFEEDGLQMGELARRSRLSKQTMTALVRRVERDGLVSRSPDPRDGRATLVSLTRRAREFEPVAARVLADVDARVRTRLDPESAGVLQAALRELAALEGSATSSAPRSRGGSPRCP